MPSATDFRIIDISVVFPDFLLRVFPAIFQCLNPLIAGTPGAAVRIHFIGSSVRCEQEVVISILDIVRHTYIFPKKGREFGGIS